jgi:dihydropteroate synthase
MGVLNLTPDSFSDGGMFRDPAAALDHAARMSAAAVAVHMQGAPADMQEAPRNGDVVGEVAELLAARAGRAEAE